jgi:hypothetical protein
LANSTIFLISSCLCFFFAASCANDFSHGDTKDSMLFNLFAIS